MEHLCFWLDNYNLLSNLGLLCLLKNHQLKAKKTIMLMLYWFAHGVNVNIIVDKLNVGAFIVCKYFDIVIDALNFKDKLFSKYYLMVRTYLGLWMDFLCMWPT